MEQGPPPPPGMGGMQGAPPMGGMPGGMPGGGQPMPDWNNLAYELGIEPNDLRGQTFVGSWIGPSGGNLSNLRAFTVKAVDNDGEEIKGMKIDFLPTTKAGTKGLRDLTGRQGMKWKIVPQGARATKRIPQYVDYDWFKKVMFQDKATGPGAGGGIPGSLPGPGGIPQATPIQ